MDWRILVLNNRFLAVAILAVAATSAVDAQDKVNLAWKLEKDKPFYQELTTTSNQSIKVMGQEVTQKQTQTFYFSYTPNAVDSNGNWTVTQKVEGVKITVDINNQPFSYDSTSTAATQTSPLSEYFKQLIGAEFKLTIDKTMKVTKVDNRDEFLRKLGSSSTAMEPLLKKILNDDALKQMADPTFGMMPNKEVTKGETWKKESKLSLGPIGGYNNTYTFTYDGKDPKDANIAIIKVDTKLNYESPTEAEGLPFKITSANLTSKNAGGTIKFDIAKGRLVESDLKLQLEGTLEIQIGGTTTKVELKQESTTLVKGTDTNPVPSTAPKAATAPAPAPPPGK
jgi:hypothetical protein